MSSYIAGIALVLLFFVLPAALAGSWLNRIKLAVEAGDISVIEFHRILRRRLVVTAVVISAPLVGLLVFFNLSGLSAWIWFLGVEVGMVLYMTTVGHWQLRRWWRLQDGGRLERVLGVGSGHAKV